MIFANPLDIFRPATTFPDMEVYFQENAIASTKSEIDGIKYEYFRRLLQSMRLFPENWNIEKYRATHNKSSARLSAGFKGEWKSIYPFDLIDFPHKEEIVSRIATMLAMETSIED